MEELILHADNCAGQNNNRFMLTFLAWKCIVEVKEHVKLCFMVARHTNIFVNDAFGHVKRRLKTTEVITPQKIIGVVRKSSIANVCVPRSEVLWGSWKSYLERDFKILAKFPISRSTHLR